MAIAFTFNLAMKLMNHGHAMRRRAWQEGVSVYLLGHGYGIRYQYPGVTRWRTRLWRSSREDREAADWEDLGWYGTWLWHPGCNCAACFMSRNREKGEP